MTFLITTNSECRSIHCVDTSRKKRKMFFFDWNKKREIPKSRCIPAFGRWDGSICDNSTIGMRTSHTSWYSAFSRIYPRVCLVQQDQGGGEREGGRKDQYVFLDWSQIIFSCFSKPHTHPPFLLLFVPKIQIPLAWWARISRIALLHFCMEKEDEIYLSRDRENFCNLKIFT